MPAGPSGPVAPAPVDAIDEHRLETIRSAAWMGEARGVVEMHRTIAHRLLAEGQPAQAFQELVRASRAVPMNARLASALTHLALITGSHGPAATLLNSGLDEAEDEELLGVMRAAARLHRRIGDPERAREFLNLLLGQRPGDRRARFQLNVLLERDEAWDELDQSLEKETREHLRDGQLRRAARSALRRARLWGEKQKDDAKAALRYGQAAGFSEQAGDLGSSFLLRLLWVRSLVASRAPEEEIDVAAKRTLDTATKAGHLERAQTFLGQLGLAVRGAPEPATVSEASVDETGETPVPPESPSGTSSSVVIVDPSLAEGLPLSTQPVAVPAPSRTEPVEIPPSPRPSARPSRPAGGPTPLPRRQSTQLELVKVAEALAPSGKAEVAAVLAAAVSEGPEPMAARKLEAHLAGQRAWRELAGFYRDMAGRSGAKETRAEWLTKLAELLESELKDVPAAAKAWADVAALTGDARATREQVRLLAASRDDTGVRGVLDAAVERAKEPLEKAKALLVRAESALAKKEVEAAKTDYRAAMVAMPGYPPAIIALAELAATEGHLEPIRLIEPALKKLPKGAASRGDSYRRLARLADAPVRDPVLAKTAWTEVLTELPFDEEAMQRLLALARQTRDDALLERLLRQRLKREPSGDAARGNWLELVAILERRGRGDEALDVLREAAELDLGHFGAQLALAERLVERKVNPEAADALERAAQATAGAQRLSLYKRLARFCRERLGDDARAQAVDTRAASLAKELNVAEGEAPPLIGGPVMVPRLRAPRPGPPSRRNPELDELLVKAQAREEPEPVREPRLFSRKPNSGLAVVVTKTGKLGRVVSTVKAAEERREPRVFGAGEPSRELGAEPKGSGKTGSAAAVRRADEVAAPMGSSELAARALGAEPKGSGKTGLAAAVRRADDVPAPMGSSELAARAPGAEPKGSGKAGVAAAVRRADEVAAPIGSSELAARALGGEAKGSGKTGSAAAVRRADAVPAPMGSGELGARALGFEPRGTGKTGQAPAIRRGEEGASVGDPRASSPSGKMPALGAEGRPPGTSGKMPALGADGRAMGTSGKMPALGAEGRPPGTSGKMPALGEDGRPMGTSGKMPALGAESRPEGTSGKVPALKREEDGVLSAGAESTRRELGAEGSGSKSGKVPAVSRGSEGSGVGRAAPVQGGGPRASREHAVQGHEAGRALGDEPKGSGRTSKEPAVRVPPEDDARALGHESRGSGRSGREPAIRASEDPRALGHEPRGSGRTGQAAAIRRADEGARPVRAAEPDTGPTASPATTAIGDEPVPAQSALQDTDETGPRARPAEGTPWDGDADTKAGAQAASGEPSPWSQDDKTHGRGEELQEPITGETPDEVVKNDPEASTGDTDDEDEDDRHPTSELPVALGDPKSPVSPSFGPSPQRSLNLERQALFEHVRKHPLEADGYKMLAEHFDTANDALRSSLMLELARALEGDPNAAPRSPKLILSEDDRLGLKHPTLRGEQGELLALVGLALCRLAPTKTLSTQTDVEFHLDSGKGAKAAADALLAAVRILGVRAPDVFVTEEPGAPYTAVHGVAPRLVVSRAAVKKPQPDPDLRFFAGRALFSLSPDLLALRTVRKEQLVFGLQAVAEAVSPKPTSPEAKLVRSSLSQRAYERVRELFPRVGRSLDLPGLAEAARASVNRAGLVVCGGVAPAIAALRVKKAAPPEMIELIRYAASERYVQLRNRRIGRR